MHSRDDLTSMFEELSFVEIESVTGGDAPHYPVPAPVGPSPGFEAPNPSAPYPGYGTPGPGQPI